MQTENKTQIGLTALVILLSVNDIGNLTKGQGVKLNYNRPVDYLLLMIFCLFSSHVYIFLIN